MDKNTRSPGEYVSENMKDEFPLPTLKFEDERPKYLLIGKLRDLSRIVMLFQDEFDVKHGCRSYHYFGDITSFYIYKLDYENMKVFTNMKDFEESELDE